MSDQQTFTDFYAANASRVLRAVIATCGSVEAAEDATAEAFQRAWARWKKLQEHPTPGGWVAVTATNLIRDNWRKEQNGLRLAPRIASPERTLDSAPFDEQLRASIARLPIRQREVIALRVLLDLSAEQTAAMLDISTGTVGTHLSRALATLRAELAQTLN